ncbi:AraC family transcriptional regulator [Cellvibrio sp. PSBB023]|uniref:helix-turn-helix domain-containing protein n=1 Tax=Cellvibrio sp. PSBB023 TaxID=1945512 RepID=UPI00099032AE|nr:helix-turn-helix domain-containing protein [Cellvibrio sp. PSBB023]AQT60511.1 AraC family transcriptional regulator [Cellvibrio sp. PSBB023]
MLEFYKKALLGLACLLVVSALVGYVCVQRTFLHLPLLPAPQSELPWVAEPGDDLYWGGRSSVTIHDANYSLDVEMMVSTQAEHPFASASLVFTDTAGKPTMVDLSSFQTISFSAKCVPANVLSFSLQTVDEKITDPNDHLSYRSPSAFFSCDENWSHTELDLTRLETAQWWLERFHLKLSMKEYRLNQVPKLLFGSSAQSPVEMSTRIQLNEITLHGQDWRYLYLFGVFLAIAWGGYGVWFFRQHTRALIGELRSRLQKDRPLVAYQQLSVEPQRDKDTDAILRFMATEYANADLNLDTMVTRIGVSRTKINDILKAELGFTFTGYLNKLRLTEAARLLAEKEEANVAEIAYSVGYKNVSYFNKLFKEEYGCTPKTFKSLCNKH